MPPMSALGQKRTFAVQNGQCPPTPKSGHVRCNERYVRYVPKADIRSRLFDDLVGSGEQRSGHVEAERLCCFQIYDEFVFAWGLHRQISGFLAP